MLASLDTLTANDDRDQFDEHAGGRAGCPHLSLQFELWISHVSPVTELGKVGVAEDHCRAENCLLERVQNDGDGLRAGIDDAPDHHAACFTRTERSVAMMGACADVALSL